MTVKSIRVSPLLLLGLLALTLAGLAGCKKQPYLAAVTQTPYIGLPANMDHLHSLDVSRLRNRAGFLDLVKNSEDKTPELKSFMTGLRERVGFDPLQQIDQLVLGARTAPANKNQPWRDLVVIARGRFDQPAEKLEKLRGWLAEEALVAPPPFKESTNPDSGYKVFQTSAQLQYNPNIVLDLNFAFPNDSLMVLTCNKELLGDTLAVMAGAAPSLQKDQFWLAMLKRPNLGALLWGTGKTSAELAANAAMLPGGSALSSAKQYYYSIDMMDDFNAEAAMVCDNIEAATSLTNGLKGGIAQVAMLLNLKFGRVAPESIRQLGRMVITNELETSKVIVRLTADERRALLDEWERLMQQQAKAVKTGQAPLAVPGAGSTPPARPAPAIAPATAPAPKR